MRAAPSRDEGRRGEGETRRGEQNGGDGDRRVDAQPAEILISGLRMILS
jgi:hypothetical protein